jgi:hypothetical protein
MLADSQRRSTAKAHRTRKSYPDSSKVILVPTGTEPTSDNMAMFLAEMVHCTSVTKQGREGHFIDMPSKLLRHVAGGNYASVVRECQDRGYIEVNGSYSTDLHFCKSFRLKERFRTGDVVEYGLLRARPDVNNRIRIDPGSETDVRLVSHFREAVIPDCVSPNPWISYAVRSIQRGEIYATRCGYRRFHSTFTALPKENRRQIRLSGQKVVETDVSNSQAICLGLLAEEQLEGRTQQRQSRPELNHMLHSARSPHLRSGKKASVRRFIEYCEQGQLYELLLEKANAAKHRLYDFVFDPRGFHTRDKQTGRPIPNRALCRVDVKCQFVRMIFCELWKMQKMPLFRIFETEFPAVADYVKLAKSEAYTGLPTKTAYKELARNCQHLESSLMIDHVARDLSQRFPIITIHDSILSPEANASEVVSEIRRRFGEMGVDVQTKST